MKLSVVVCLALVATALTVPASEADAAPLTKVLVFSKTAGFRHSSIPDGIAAIQQLGAVNGFSVTASSAAVRLLALGTRSVR